MSNFEYDLNIVVFVFSVMLIIWLGYAFGAEHMDYINEITSTDFGTVFLFFILVYATPAYLFFLLLTFVYKKFDIWRIEKPVEGITMLVNLPLVILGLGFHILSDFLKLKKELGQHINTGIDILLVSAFYLRIFLEVASFLFVSSIFLWIAIILIKLISKK